MARHHHVHYHVPPDMGEKLDRLLVMGQQILARLDKLQTEEEKLMDTMQDLAADIADENQVINGAVVLINGFAARLAAAGTDPKLLAQLRTDVQTNRAALAAAVAANTPAPAQGAATVTVTPADAKAAADAAAAATPLPNTGPGASTVTTEGNAGPLPGT